MTQFPIEIRHLRYFVAVAEAGTFTAAAKRLGLSQPAVSEQMRRLESTLHISLFQRKGKRIYLTSGGLIFEDYARSILGTMEKLVLQINRQARQNRGRIPARNR